MASTLHIAGLALEADWVEAWGTWVGGLGTIAAVFWAMYALRRESRRSERESLRARLLETRTVLAYDFGNGSSEVENSRIGFLYFTATVGNLGQGPITHVTGQLTFEPTLGRAKGERPLQVLAAGQSGTLEFFLSQEETVTWGGDLHKQTRRNGQNSIDPFSLLISWNDVHGQRWIREYGSQNQPRAVGPYDFS